jgi:hypothetical protein
LRFKLFGHLKEEQKFVYLKKTSTLNLKRCCKNENNYSLAENAEEFLLASNLY